MSGGLRRARSERKANAMECVMEYGEALIAEDMAYERWRGVFFVARRDGDMDEERAAYKDYADAFAARTLIVQRGGYALWNEVSGEIDNKLDVRRRLDAALSRRRAFGDAAMALAG